MKVKLIVGFIIAIASATVWADQIRYVSSKLAPVYQQANLQSKVQIRLAKNAEVEIISQKGIWMNIIYLGGRGWVSRYSVSANRPADTRVSIFDRLKSFFNNTNRRERLSLVSTSGGIRGLSDYDTENTGTKDFEAVEYMESLQPGDQEIADFVGAN